MSPGRLRCCDWCRRQLPATRSTQRFCNQRCRQFAWRARRLLQLEQLNAQPLRLAYADPPYPGFARRLYRRPEVDHAGLIASLLQKYDGWALSTGAYALRDLLPLCPPSIRVCAWVKPIGVSTRTRGPHNTWEPLLVMPGRELLPGKRDWLSAQPARHGGDLIGRKPVAFVCWLFELLGALPGDSVDDLFPGTGIVRRTWAELSRAAAVDANRRLA